MDKSGINSVGWFHYCFNFVSMSKDWDSIESLIAAGFIGAGLGALLMKNKEEGAMLGALLGAAFASTTKANEKAQKSNQPLFEAADGKLYKILPGGQKQFVKDLPKVAKNWEKEFFLK
jgi:hypothetical protein